eukprot:jgi/Picre1/27970/NNA_000931.t1
MYTEYSLWYDLPKDLTCDGVSSHCVMQWHWVTMNSCVPKDSPKQYRRPIGLRYCEDEGSPYPEEFWNCADISHERDQPTAVGQRSAKPKILTVDQIALQRRLRQRGTLQWPLGQHGICGDPYNAPKPRDHEVGGTFYGTGAPVVTYEEGSVIRLEVTVTTNHNGRSSKPGEKWFYTTPGDPMYNEYTMYYQLPDLLTCDGVDSRCILQFYWVSGNSCNPPNTPEKYKRPFGLPDCGSPGAAYPEEFWNCADIKIVSKSWKSFYPETIGGMEKQVRSSLLPSYAKGIKDKTMHEQAAATLFCTTKVNAYGMFPDADKNCRGYFICQELASWYVNCPSGMRFDAETLVCQYTERAVCIDLRYQSGTAVQY